MKPRSDKGKPRKDLTGRRFGRLTAVRYVGSKPSRWECRCDCGRVLIVQTSNLTSRTSKSCGRHRRKFSPETARERARQSQLAYYYRNREERNRTTLDCRRRRWEKHPEKREEARRKSREYAEKNRARLREYFRNLYRDLQWKARKLAACRARYADSPATMAAKARERRAADPVHARKIAHDWRARNPDKVRSQNRQAYERRPEYFKDRANARRQRVADVTDPADAKVRRQFIRHLRTAPRIPCYWCGQPTFPDSRHMDHIKPIAKGGRHHILNLCCSCPDCNLSKGTRRPEEFAGQFELPFLD